MLTTRLRWLLLLFWPALGLLWLPAPAAPSPAFEARGPHQAQVIDLRWTDSSRGRVLPLRLRLPDAPGPRPVILFSHGLGGSVDGGGAWGEHWASHGFLVIHLQHPGSDQAVWSGSAWPAAALRQAADVGQFLARVGDVRFVLDELARRRQAGEAVAARADLDRIGVSGHSFGAITTQAIAGQDHGAAGPPLAGTFADPRPRAFVALSPSARGREQLPQFAPIVRPFLGVTGTDDGLVGMGLGVPPENRLLPFEGMPPGDKYLLVLAGAGHMAFNGGPRRGGQVADPRANALHVRWTAAVTTAFWRAYLLDDPIARAWLQALDPGLDGAGRFQRK